MKEILLHRRGGNEAKLAAVPDENPLRLETAQPPRRIIQVVWALVAGGMEVYALTIARRLSAAKFRVLMCPLDAGGVLEPELRRLSIPCFVMNRRPGIDLKLIWRLYRLFRSTRVDVVHTHQFNQLFYSALGARLAGARIVHTQHSIEELRRRRIRWALRILGLACESVVAIGEDGERVLRESVRISRRKLRIIHAGVESSHFAVSREEARRALNLDLRDRVALVVARLAPEKNHILLLRAFAYVSSQIDNAILLAAGAGPEEAAIRACAHRLGISGRVRILGARRDIPQLLAAADVFVLSSTREGLPISVLEAMAAGRPVVSTAVGDLPRIVTDGHTGILVDPDNPAALAQALLKLFRSPALAAELGSNGSAAIKPYSVRSMIHKYEELYESILDQRN